MTDKDWFETWFDSPYYHILYKNRDDREATQFIEKLIAYISPRNDAKILDLACGRGRHSLVLNQLGYDVVGVDLAPSSIDFAKQSIQRIEGKSKATINFDVHDMREIYRPKHFDLVFNLFTSFGYFNDNNDNLRVLNSVASSLKSYGIFVLDFMNCNKVGKDLSPAELKQIDGIDFNISRRIVDNHILKSIQFTDNGREFNYEEKVSALKYEDLQKLFKQSELNISQTFGNYSLEPYEPASSDRLIIVAIKGNR